MLIIAASGSLEDRASTCSFGASFDMKYVLNTITLSFISEGSSSISRNLFKQERRAGGRKKQVVGRE